jgi:hypothetical protein
MWEYSEAYLEKHRISRKPHRCCECNGTIFYKEKYVHVSGIWGGQPDSFKFCVDCWEMRKDFKDVGKIAFGEVCDIVFSWYCRRKDLIEKIIDIKDRRGATVYPWMRKMLR